MRIYRWRVTAKVKKLGIVCCLLFFLYYLSVPSTRVVESSNELTSVSKIFSQVYYRYLLTSFNLTKSWFQHKKFRCRNNFIGYGHQFARLRDVIFLPKTSQGQFKLSCDQNEIADYQFLSQTKEVPVSHLNVWMKTLGNTGREYLVEKTSDVTTLAVFRYQFVNLYNQMTDFYNAYLVMKLLNLKPEKTDILLTDGNLPGSLDKVWDILYGNVTNRIDLDQPILYKDIIWTVLGYNSPLNFHSIESLPYVEEFSNFFKRKHGATEKKFLDCKGISILFIWRQDYVSVEGQPKHLISAKVQNEQELINEVQEDFPGHYVAGIQMDQQDIRDQVQWLSQTDILVGMHGAGMSGILSLPSHAGVLELFPSYYSPFNYQFQSMAKWRKLHYIRWQNMNPTNEYPDGFTYIPAPVVTQRLTSLYYAMCGHKPDRR